MEKSFKIGILTDTGTDLPESMLSENKITVIPFFTEIKGKTYKSGKDISVDDLLDISLKEKTTPKTTQISPIRYSEIFGRLLEEYEGIVYIGIGSGFSGTINNANLAASEIGKDRVRVIDSGNLSSGEGLVVLRACRLRKEGKNLDEIEAGLKEVVPLVRTQFAINTLEFLHMGGRCSGTAALFGQLFHVKPIIKVINGKMTVSRKPVGAFKKALDSMLNDARRDREKLDPEYVFVTHCKADADAEYLIRELKKFLPAESIHEGYAGNTISTHCGRRTIGILYVMKNKDKAS